jgi:meiotic recombination protein SPO11
MLKVEDLDTGAVAEKIESIAQRIAKDVMEGRGYTFTVPSRASSNQHYVKSLDRIVLGGNKVRLGLLCSPFCSLLTLIVPPQGTRTFSSVSEVRKTTITARCMQLIHNILGKGIHITKRDLFYTDVKLFVKQAESDGVLDDLSTMIGCTRSNLNVVASDKGLVVGRVQVRLNLWRGALDLFGSFSFLTDPPAVPPLTPQPCPALAV